MTMTRNDKSRHQAVMTSTGRRGYTSEEFASPKLRGAARADRGHCLMTRREYVEHRIGRRAMPVDHIDSVIERRARLLRAARVTSAGRRINGYRRGYRPGSHEVARCTCRVVVLRGGEYALAG
jgi:hypothetical protein